MVGESNIIKQIKAFRAPVFNETVQEKQKIIDKEYPGVYPCAPILDILFSNHILNNAPKSDSWGNLVRYSIKLPTFHPRIIQPRVIKCHTDEEGRRFLLRKYSCYEGSLGNYFFDHMFFTSIIPIDIELNDIMSAHNEKLLALDQLKYCLNNLQAKSVLSMSNMYPNRKYILNDLYYDDNYRRGYPIMNGEEHPPPPQEAGTSNTVEDSEMREY